MTPRDRAELFTLLELVCEQRATPQQWQTLKEWVVRDPQARRVYVQYIQLHGSLHWDAGGVGAQLELGESTAVARRPSPPVRFRHRLAGLAAVVLLLVVAVALWMVPRNPNLAQPEQHDPAGQNRQMAQQPAVETPAVVPAPELPRIRLTPAPAPVPEVPPANVANVPTVQPVGDTDEDIIRMINTQLRTAWNENQVTVAARASEERLLRRVLLDLAGRIPSREEVLQWQRDPRTEKQQRLVDLLLGSEEPARHLATVWTNLLVGRSSERAIDRDALRDWLRDGFQQNRPWDQTVTALLTAEGTASESGPANFLLAHLNNEAVPATAITARILLCEQLQCAQCHTHPTVKEWGQERFWEINAFFRNVTVVEPPAATRRARRLVERNAAFRPSYYETLQGVMKIAYPKVGDVEFLTRPAQPLRQELARLLLAGDRPQPARAFVNRVWAQLMGQGFTTPVDDMGPHHPVSHPELLEGLTTAFVRSGYDVKRLTRWICLSDAYQLESLPDAATTAAPSLFQHMPVKPLPAETLYDSLRIAAGVAPEELNDPNAPRRRELWLEQFFRALENEENSESTTLDGTLPQALMMINGDLVSRAISLEEGSEVSQVAADTTLNEAQKIEQLFVAALARKPSTEEAQKLRDVFRQQSRQLDDRRLTTQQAQAEACRDLYWALLNSSEFSSIR